MAAPSNCCPPHFELRVVEEDFPLARVEQPARRGLRPHPRDELPQQVPQRRDTGGELRARPGADLRLISSGFACQPRPNSVGTAGRAAQCPGHLGYTAGAQGDVAGPAAAGQPRGAPAVAQVRPWIEPAQSFEKSQLGLGQMFCNSLRLTWQMSLWADSAVLLRTMVWLDTPVETALLAPLLPRQLELELPLEK